MEQFSLLDSRVQINMDETTQDFINQIGRTEDIRFSSDNKMLAITGFIQNSCILLDIVIDRSGQKPVVNVSRGFKIQSKNFHSPHGIEFIDNEYLIVANRNGYITLFDIKNLPSTSSILELKPIKTIRSIGILKRLSSPGSICILNYTGVEVDILACNNYAHRISRHILSLKSRFKFVQNSVYIEKGLNIPDGIAINNDKSWIAISDHSTLRVLLFSLNEDLTPNTTMTGQLLDTGYPHGVRFSNDGKMIFVADASSPYINVYQSLSGIWTGKHFPIKKYKVLSEVDFLIGHTNPEEGGPKGIDISADETLLVMTNQEAPLDIFFIKA